MVKKLSWLCLMVIIFISCQSTKSITDPVDFNGQMEITKEGEPGQASDSPTPSVEATQEARSTIEIVSAQQDVIEEPLPRYLGYVDPAPGKIYTIAEYNELVTFSSDITEPSICFSVGPLRLMEPGDFPTMEQFLSWIYVEVDDVRISQFSGLRTTNSLGAEASNRFTNEIIWKAPDGSPYHLCYAAELGVGIHTATIFIEKSEAKRESYTWSFEITK